MYIFIDTLLITIEFEIQAVQLIQLAMIAAVAMIIWRFKK